MPILGSTNHSHGLRQQLLVTELRVHINTAEKGRLRRMRMDPTKDGEALADDKRAYRSIVDRFHRVLSTNLAREDEVCHPYAFIISFPAEEST